MILVTGGTGFIGRRLVKQLASRFGAGNIICLAAIGGDPILEGSGRAVLKQLGVGIIEADLMTKQGLAGMPKNFEYVFHLASCTETAQRDHSINDVGTLHLLEALSPLNDRTHFIYTSSIAVNDHRPDYGVPIDEETPAPIRPQHEYGRKKLLTEQLLIEHARKNSMKLSIVRVCGVYGIGCKRAGLFDSVEDLTLKGALLTRLNWPGKIGMIYVEDMARFLLEVSQRPSSGAEYEFYIPAVESLTVEGMSLRIAKANGMILKIIRLPSMVWFLAGRLGQSKGFFEKILPHGLYNRLWQFSLLVNNEYWNEPRKVKDVFGPHIPMRFEQYCQLKATGSIK